MLTIDGSAQAYRHTLGLAGTVCEIETNYRRLGSSLRYWTVAAPAAIDAGRFSMQILVTTGTEAPAARPHFRGLHHVVIASFGHANVFVFDLLRRHIIATVSKGVALDPLFWNQRLLPIVVGVLGPTVGVVPVHCACLSLNGEGLLIAGVSGAGKSTLTATLTQSGFDYVSDDWTYLGRRFDRLMANGMATRVKLLPDAIRHFPQLAEHSLGTSLNGELAYEVEAGFFGGRVLRSCEPRWCIFLARSSRSKSTFAPMCAEQARRCFQSSVERLPHQLADTARTRAEIIEQIAHLDCWTFRYGGTPQFAAQEILSFVSSQRQDVTA